MILPCLGLALKDTFKPLTPKGEQKRHSTFLTLHSTLFTTHIYQSNKLELPLKLHRG